MCDVTEDFHRILSFPYNSFGAFHRDLIRFQHVTATCYAIRSSLSASNYQRITGKVLPPGFPYRWVQYKCVHSRTRCKAVRNADYGCESQFTVTVRKKMLHLVRSHFLHSHSFQEGKPWLYASNRRLSPEQHQLVCSMMHTFQTCDQLRSFILDSFGLHLNRFDLRRLRLASGQQKQSGGFLKSDNSYGEGPSMNVNHDFPHSALETSKPEANGTNRLTADGTGEMNRAECAQNLADDLVKVLADMDESDFWRQLIRLHHVVDVLAMDPGVEIECRSENNLFLDMQTDPSLFADSMLDPDVTSPESTH
ncbi:hypothetical protein CRM22_001319 [Opisthorchis felineus]|uniref:ZSWIM3 N-terminal domain-containing protein n=1 Tax=Opisthorchis felineus TaxID=147828 RepID=A0A4S2MBB4_OPIFE|nr:hypothetical protein CRM22_001319 [Opisthorchis felineus]